MKKKKQSTEYQRKKSRGLALASAYVDADLWRDIRNIADEWSELDGEKWTASDVLRVALTRLVDGHPSPDIVDKPHG